MPPTSTLPAWFTRAIEALKAGDIDGWMEIYTPDAVHEFPFAPEGAIRRLIGRAPKTPILILDDCSGGESVGPRGVKQQPQRNK